MDILRCMDLFLITKILDLAYMRCLSQNKSDTKLFRVYLFTVFTIKRPRALASLAHLGILIVKTVTNIDDEYAPPSLCSEDPSSCHLTNLNRMILQLHACIA